MGTAKNAGKTTVLNEIIKEYKNECIAITSIGLDGEKIDNVTNLPKPQIKVFKNTIIATAYDCITNDVIVHENTNISTPLGDIVIVEAIKEQEILVAGPSTKTQMIEVIKRIKKYNPSKIFVDGALFRKTFAAHTVSDAIILSTGASYDSDMKKVVYDTYTIYSQFQNEQVPSYLKDILIEENTTCTITRNGKIHYLDDIFLQTNMDLIKSNINPDIASFYIKGALTDQIIKALIEVRFLIDKMTIIVDDATHILCNTNLYHKLEKMNVDVKVLYKSEILFVSYNPTSPYGYTFDDKEFKTLLEKHIDKSVINVLKDRK